MNYSEMNPEMRASIDEAARNLETDAAPTAEAAPESKGHKVAAEYVANEGDPLLQAIADERAALEEKKARIGAEYEEDLQRRLELAFDQAVNDVMFNAGLDMSTETGRDEHAKLEENKAAIIKLTMDKIGFEKSAKPEEVLLEIFAKYSPESKEASA